MNNMESSSNIFRIMNVGDLRYVRVAAIMCIGGKSAVFATDGWDKDWNLMPLGNTDNQVRHSQLLPMGTVIYSDGRDVKSWLICGGSVSPLLKEEVEVLARINPCVKLERGHLYMTKNDSLIRFAGKSGSIVLVSEIFTGIEYGKLTSKDDVRALGFPAHEAHRYVGCMPFSIDLGLRDLTTEEVDACMLLHIPLVKQ